MTDKVYGVYNELTDTAIHTKNKLVAESAR